MFVFFCNGKMIIATVAAVRFVGPWHWKKECIPPTATQRSSISSQTQRCGWYKVNLQIYSCAVHAPLVALPPCYCSQWMSELKFLCWCVYTVSKEVVGAFNFIITPYSHKNTLRQAPASGSRNMHAVLCAIKIKTVLFRVFP